jgi:hypothetical protein
MDVVPPPAPDGAPVSAPGETPVVTAPPPEPDTLQIGDDIADQIAADSTTPPPPEHAQLPSSDSAQGGSQPTSAMAAPPEEDETQPVDASDSPSDLIQAEIQHEADNPVAAVTKAPKAKNPAQAAVIATVFITLALAGLAVFAYMSTQN